MSSELHSAGGLLVCKETCTTLANNADVTYVSLDETQPSTRFVEPFVPPVVLCLHFFAVIM